MPSRQERRSVSVGSILFLIHSSAVEHHRAAIVEVDEIGVHTRILAIVRRPAVDPVFAQIGRAFGLRPGLAVADLSSSWAERVRPLLDLISGGEPLAAETLSDASQAGTTAPVVLTAAPVANPEARCAIAKSAARAGAALLRKLNRVAALDVAVRRARRDHRARRADCMMSHGDRCAMSQPCSPWLQMKSSTGTQSLPARSISALRQAGQHVGCSAGAWRSERTSFASAEIADRNGQPAALAIDAFELDDVDRLALGQQSAPSPPRNPERLGVVFEDQPALVAGVEELPPRQQMAREAGFLDQREHALTVGVPADAVRRR